MNTSLMDNIWKGVKAFCVAGMLLVISGCMPDQPIKTPASAPFLDSPISAVSATPTNAPTLTDIQTPAPTPALVVFPLPKAVPVEDFPSPKTETMQTGQLFNGTWTTYTAPEWLRQAPQGGVSQDITSIAEVPAGTFWFSTTGSGTDGGTGVYRFDGKTWTRFRQVNGLPLDEVFPIVAAPDGAIWFGSFCCGVTRYDGKSWTNYTTENGLPSDNVRSLTFTADGVLWVGTSDNGLARFDGKSWQTYLGGKYAAPSFILPNRTVLVSSSDGGSAKLYQFNGQSWVNYPTPWMAAGKYTSAVAAAPNGDVWFATEFTHVYQLSVNTWTAYSLGTDNMIVSAAAARDGSIWFGTFAGAYRFDGKNWSIFKPQGDSGNNWVGPILAASDGSIWLAYDGGIAHFVPPATP